MIRTDYRFAEKYRPRELLESPERADAFVRDPEYAPFAKARQAGSVSRFYILDDTDVAGTIPYLSKASA